MEDSDAYAHLARFMLDEHFGSAVSVVHARSLAEALRLIATAGPHDVVVADLGLPDARGIEVVEHLRAATPAPVVVLSGLGTPGTDAAVRAAGAVGHVVKGGEHVALAAAITAAIG